MSVRLRSDLAVGDRLRRDHRSFDRIDIRDVDGRWLKDQWNAGPQTYLGMLVHGFPNMLMVMDPRA